MGGFLLEFGVKEHRFDPSGEMNIFGRGGKRTIVLAPPNLFDRWQK
jgi:hypothetical protein